MLFSVICVCLVTILRAEKASPIRFQVFASFMLCLGGGRLTLAFGFGFLFRPRPASRKKNERRKCPSAITASSSCFSEPPKAWSWWFLCGEWPRFARSRRSRSQHEFVQRYARPGSHGWIPCNAYGAFPLVDGGHRAIKYTRWAVRLVTRVNDERADIACQR